MAVRNIEQDVSLETLWSELVYTQARLAADPGAADLAAAVAQLVKRALQVQQGQYECWAAEILAQAQVDAANYGLDGLVEDLAVALLLILREDRQSPRWTRYFGSDTPSGVRRLGLESQVARVAGWPESLKGEKETELQTLGSRLETEIVAGAAALAARRKAAAARADHRARDIMTLVDDVNALRLTTYGELIGRVATRGEDRAWPEEFFRRGTRTPRKSAPAAPLPA